MTEIAKCRCGARAHLQGHVDDVDGEFVSIACYDGKCGWTSPWRRTEAEAIAAWNALMRPRPVARWGSPGGVTYLYVGRAVLGYVLTSQSGSESAVCGITGEHFRGYDARAWLEERVRAAGFDVEDVSDG